METKLIIHSPNFKKQGKAEIITKIENTSKKSTAVIRISFDEIFEFSGISSKTAFDFFFISCFVYGIDRFIKRDEFSTDGWSRELNVSFPVYDVNKWTNVKNELEKTLSFLTGDYWTIDFNKNNLDIKAIPISDEYSKNKFHQVNLFSGGLDSLIGAIDFLAEPKNIDKKILLVSHFDSQMKGPSKEQEELYESFPNEYKARAKRVSLVNVSLQETSLNDREKTFRSRSLLFLGIAALVADYQKLPIIVPENGSVSLNYPLNPSRRGACSTRTTHPTFISLVQKLLTKLNLHNAISNPYEFNTKGEMVKDCLNLSLLKKIVELSNSCGKKGHTVNRTNPKSTHCGVCMPCTYRKAALIGLIDKTTYGDDLNKKYSGKKLTPFFKSQQGQDLNACFDFIERKIDKEQIRQELIVTGINDFSKIDNYVNLVARTKQELKVLIDKTCTNKSYRKKAGL